MDRLSRLSLELILSDQSYRRKAEAFAINDNNRNPIVVCESEVSSARHLLIINASDFRMQLRKFFQVAEFFECPASFDISIHPRCDSDSIINFLSELDFDFSSLNIRIVSYYEAFQLKRSYSKIYLAKSAAGYDWWVLAGTEIADNQTVICMV